MAFTVPIASMLFFGLLVSAAIILLLILVLQALYNIFLHPLRSFPGPWYAACSEVWYVLHLVKGDHFRQLHELHLAYGPVVRVAPNELAFVNAEAWKDIYGFRPGLPEFPKAKSQTFGDDPAHPNILDAPREQHAKLRKLLSNAFSDKAMREQEGILRGYVVSLVDGLRKKMEAEEEVDLVSWYMFATFDIVGHLTFAESFSCLSSSAYQPWVRTMLSLVKNATWTRAVQRISTALVLPMRLALYPPAVIREIRMNIRLTQEKIDRRRERSPEYTDFLTHLLAAEKKGILDPVDLSENAPIIVVAGSESTATLLAGASFYILREERIYSRLVSEIRGAFARPEDMTLAKLGECPYLLAVLEEALRMYPPATGSHMREIPPGGATVAGRFVPGGTLVGIPKYACFWSPENYTDPEEFVPERWLGKDEKYAGDRRHALQPFHVGPRNCIGRNLAYAEMRLILAYLLLEFDMELCAGQESWPDQRAYETWEKKPLMVRLSPAARA